MVTRGHSPVLAIFFRREFQEKILQLTQATKQVMVLELLTRRWNLLLQKNTSFSTYGFVDKHYEVSMLIQKTKMKLNFTSFSYPLCSN